MNILQACAVADISVIEQLLCGGSGPSSTTTPPNSSQLIRHRYKLLFQRDNHNWTPLHHAVQSNVLAAVTAVLVHCPARYRIQLLRAESFEGETSLYRACSNRTVELSIVQCLTAADADLVNWVQNEGQSPLHRAIEIDRFDIVRHLIETAHAPVNYADELDHETALFYAARRGNREIIRYLMFGTDCNCQLTNANGISAFSMLKEFDYARRVAHYADADLFRMTVDEHMPMSLVFREYILQALRHRDAAYMRQIIDGVYLDPNRNGKFADTVRRMQSAPTQNRLQRNTLCLALHESLEAECDGINWTTLFRNESIGSIWSLLDLFQANADLFHEYLSLVLLSANGAITMEYFLFEELIGIPAPLPSVRVLFDFFLAITGYGYSIQELLELIVDVEMLPNDEPADALVKSLVPFGDCDRPYMIGQLTYRRERRRESVDMCRRRFVESDNVTRDCQRFGAIIDCADYYGDCGVAKLFDLCRSVVRERVFKVYAEMGGTNDRIRLERMYELTANLPVTIRNKLLYKMIE